MSEVNNTMVTRLLESVRMHLVQTLLPVYGNDGRPFPASSYADVRREFAERFGGLRRVFAAALRSASRKTNCWFVRT